MRYAQEKAGRVIEVTNRNSTRLCADCGALTGPTGRAGLKVRTWVCACGATHDRDVNAAVNTLRFGAVLAHESGGDLASETATVSGSRRSGNAAGSWEQQADAEGYTEGRP